MCREQAAGSVRSKPGGNNPATGSTGTGAPQVLTGQELLVEVQWLEWAAIVGGERRGELGGVHGSGRLILSSCPSHLAFHGQRRGRDQV